MVASACLPLSLPTWMSLETFAALKAALVCGSQPLVPSVFAFALHHSKCFHWWPEPPEMLFRETRGCFERLGCSPDWVCPSHVGGENRAGVQTWPPSLWSNLCVQLSPGSPECGLSTLWISLPPAPGQVPAVFSPQWAPSFPTSWWCSGDVNQVEYAVHALGRENGIWKANGLSGHIT